MGIDTGREGFYVKEGRCWVSIAFAEAAEEFGAES